MKILFSALLPLIFLISCSSPSTPPVTVAQNIEPQPKTAIAPVVEQGKVMASVPVKDFPAESYALYLPVGFIDTTNFPLIVFFDPHGDGTVPIEKYKALADKYHFILAGSNNSKNGMDIQAVNAIAAHLLSALQSTYHIKKEHICFAGFSGGAVAAIKAAITIGNVTHVVYCGQSANLEGLKHPLTFLGIAGTHDMNYSNVLQLHQMLQGSPYAHYLVEWNGKHEWPDAAVFANAFLEPDKIPAAKLKQITTAQITALKQEDAEKNDLITCLGTKDAEWWKQKVASLKKSAAKDPKADRLLGYVSLACYSFSKNLLSQNRLEEAEKILAIYGIADPGNKDCEEFTRQLQQKKRGY